MIKYSDQIARWLKDLGYTHYFYVGGGNIMHLTESLDNELIGVPVVHEVAAGIAAEYFNVVNEHLNKKALALVTAGPGLSNIITAMAGSWLESRELLVIGGQVKSSDLASEKLRSRGIQEIKGTRLAESLCKISYQVKKPIDAKKFYSIVSSCWSGRKGPVFLEMPIDVQARPVKAEQINKWIQEKPLKQISQKKLKSIAKLYNKSSKPILLLGGGVSYKTSLEIQGKLFKKGVPVMTTYNGIDRYDPKKSNYFGRPNTWGQRSSNIIIQKSDLIIAAGTRLGMQQTGFNWQEFGREAKIVHIDIDKSELNKGHPSTDLKLCVDANDFIKKFCGLDLLRKDDWIRSSRKIRETIPRVENVNKTGKKFISPYEFIVTLETLTKKKDVIVPCSSGSAFTLSMQLLNHKQGQRVITNKSLASMGYGLSGAIGASIGIGKNKRTILIEGDGGFAQNLQEVGTAKINKLNLKIFLFHDQGYASIRMTQQNYFNGKYLGCDEKSGLGLPDWQYLFKAWGINPIKVNKGFDKNKLFLKEFEKSGLSVFLVQIDPEQTYYPKISSRVTKRGGMESNPIDKMTPEIDYLKS